MAEQSVTTGDPATETAVAAAREQAARIRECADRMRAATGTGSAAGGRIEASVDGFAAPSDLWIGPELVDPAGTVPRAGSNRRERAGRIGELVAEAFAEAAADLARRQGGILAQALPEAAGDQAVGEQDRSPGRDDSGAVDAAPDYRGGRARWH